MDDRQTKAMATARLLLTHRVIAFHPLISQITRDIKAALFLCQLMYWSDKGEDIRGWIWKTQEQWTTETTLTRREQESARAKLRTLRLLEEARRGTPAKLYFRVNWGTLFALLEGRISMAETAILECTNPPSQNGENAHTRLAETDNHNKETKITTDNTPPHSPSVPEWLSILRKIDGWKERGAPHEDNLTAWADRKGFSTEYLEDHANGVGSQQLKSLRGCANLAQKFQVACNKGYYSRGDGKVVPIAGHNDERLARIKERKARANG